MHKTKYFNRMSLISTLQPVIDMKKCWRRVKNSNPKMLIYLAEFGQSNVLSINFYFFLISLTFTNDIHQTKKRK